MLTHSSARRAAQRPPVTQQRPLSALLTATAYPNSDALLLLVTVQQLMATHREWEGYQHFGRLAEGSRADARSSGRCKP